jgi:hypothetical protein
VAQRSFGTVIVGAGPAGIAVLLAACRGGKLEDFLDRGVAVVEASDHFGAGQIGNYAINSDSTALTFIDCIKSNSSAPFKALKDHMLTKAFAASDQDAIPLHLVGQMSSLIGDTLRKIVAKHPACAIYRRSKVMFAREEPPEDWLCSLSGPDGRTIELIAQNLVIATGGHQPKTRLDDEYVGGQPLLAQCGGRLLQSGEVLRTGGLDRIARRLAGKTNPKIVVLGGSTSAVSVAHSLLNRLRPELTAPNAVSLLHRQPLRIYYASVAEALADGYRDFTPDDLCPLTKRVFRFAGLRLDSKDLICAALGIGGRQPDPRLRLHHLQAQDPDALQIIAQADLVIACFGYRPIGLKLLGRHGRPIRLHASTSVRAPLVDEHCRILDEQRLPLKNLFGIGLASGFTPRGALGGEPSFSGQANGLWLWQTAVGRLIVDRILTTQAARKTDRLGKIEQDDFKITEFSPHTRVAQTGQLLAADLVGGD